MLSPLQILKLRRAPVEGVPQIALELPDQNLKANSGDFFVDIARHFQGDGLQFSVSGPAGVVVGQLTGQLVIPTDMAWHNEAVTVIAGNPNGSVSQTFRVAVEAVGEPPRVVAHIPDQVFEAGSGDQIVEVASYFEGDGLRYRVSGSSYALIDISSGRLTYSTGSQPSNSSVTVWVVNDHGSATQTFQVIVKIVDEPPRIIAQIPDLILDAYSGDQIIETKAYFDGKNLLFSVSGPAGVITDAFTGLVTVDTAREWTTDTITVTAQNSGGDAANSFQVTLEREEALTYDPAPTQMLSSITVTEPLRDGTPQDVVWTFNQPAECGQYCTGDWFVVAVPGLELVSVTPECRRVPNGDDPFGRSTSGTDLTGRYIHGLQVDPTDADKQGFDSWTSHSVSNNTIRTHRGVSARASIPVGSGDFQADWSPALNIDPAFVMDENAVANPDHAVNTPRGPVPLESAKSLVKAVSRRVPSQSARGGQEFLCVLTVVENVPAEGAFRPPMGGNAVDLPVTWTEAAVQPFLEALPRLQFTFNVLRTPTSHPAQWAIMQRDAKRNWQAWSARSTQVRNITPIWQAAGGVIPYRREIGETMRRMCEALIADCPWQDKKDILIGLIQLGIDQAAVSHFFAKGEFITASGQSSWDAGRSAPTVLALAALPDKDWLQEAWDLSWPPRPGSSSEIYHYMPGSAWEDKRNFYVITQNDEFSPSFANILPKHSSHTYRGVWNWIDPNPDSAPPGPVEGLVGHATYNGRGSRPEGFSALPGQASGYLNINTTAARDTLIPLWLIPGVYAAYNNNGLLRWLDRLYLTDPRPLVQIQAQGRWWREVRNNPLLEAPFSKTPNRLFQSPEVAGFGTALIVTVPIDDGDNGSPITGIDLRYRPISLTFNEEGGITSESIVGPWVVIEDIELNEDRQYVVSPLETGGLEENRWYAVQVRMKNALGAGAWSRTHTGGWFSNQWASNGRMFSGQAIGQTQAQLALERPEFVSEPTISSFMSAGSRARVVIVDPPRSGANYTGFPFPTPSYRWMLNGQTVGEDDRDFDIPSTAAGQVLSCEVTLTNSQGQDSTVISAGTVTAAAASRGYVPTPMIAEGDVGFVRANSVNILSSAFIKQATISFIFGSRFEANATLFTSARSELIMRPNGILSMYISRGVTGTRGYMRFQGPRTDRARWYLLNVDVTEVNPEDRIKLWVGDLDGLLPPERIMPFMVTATSGDGDFQFNENWAFTNNASHRIFPADPPEQAFIIGDLYLETGVVRPPSAFIANNGQFRDPATVGNPFLLMGSTMTVEDWNDGVNLGTTANPMANTGNGGEFSAMD